jgi:biopolymer transport protein ExbD
MKKTIIIIFSLIVVLGIATLFIYTITISKPTALKLNPPDNEGVSKEVVSNLQPQNTLSIILGKNDRVFWHQKLAEQVETNDLNETSYSPNGIQKIILDSRKKATDTKKFTVFIKPTKECNWKNTVDILDEMAISKSERYAIVDASSKELEVYKQKTAN